ncbi:MAG: hypothetical protein IBX72_04645 [Nitrospirae bacterium]|nr:hypothetical protein [Nitrospirota bacterium]
MTVLEVLKENRKCEDVFKKYDKKIGKCVCCEFLFTPLNHFAGKFDLDLQKLIEELETYAMGIKEKTN